MHIEVLAEDSSGARLLEMLLPRLWGEKGAPHTWRIHPFKGIGRLPANLHTQPDPANRALLANLPGALRAYGKSGGIDAVLVVLDTDSRDCRIVLSELKAVVESCNPAPNAMFRLVIEEIEAWYLGDRAAVLAAYPKAKTKVLERYVPDSVCGTWEVLADAVHPGGHAALKKPGSPLPGQLKHDWAGKIGPHLDFERNLSPSFRKFKEGVTRLVAGETP